MPISPLPISCDKPSLLVLPSSQNQGNCELRLRRSDGPTPDDDHVGLPSRMEMYHSRRRPRPSSGGGGCGGDGGGGGGGAGGEGGGGAGGGGGGGCDGGDSCSRKSRSSGVSGS